jgi:hypothetical protein
LRECFQRRGIPGATAEDVSPFVLLNRTLPLLVPLLIAESIAIALSDRYRGAILIIIFLLTLVVSKGRQDICPSRWLPLRRPRTKFKGDTMDPSDDEVTRDRIDPERLEAIPPARTNI